MIPSTLRLLDFREFRYYSDTFVETGSGGGGGIYRALEAGYQSVYSIEADPYFFQVCKDKFFAGNETDHRVHLYFGESQRKLPRVLAAIAKPCVVFLDAHPAGEMTYGHQELLEGDTRYGQDAIIRQELQALLARDEKHLIIIDDINGDELTAAAYAAMILARYPNYRFLFYDENLNGQWYHPNKSLVAIPEELSQ